LGQQGEGRGRVAPRGWRLAGGQPDLALRLRVGDEIVCAGSPEALEHAEKVLLAG
jgi:hypothetical protein